MKTILLAAAASLALATAGLAQEVTPPAGVYTLDKNHASVTWRVNHLGTSNYTARFDEFDAKLSFDPKAPDKSTLEVTIDPASLDLDYDAGDGFYNELTGKPTAEKPEGDQNFFRTPKFPTIDFKSTKVELTGERTGKVTGDLTFLGQTHPLTLDVTFNGARAGYGSPNPVIGFSGKTTVKRSEWGMTYGVPAVGDDVEVWIEAEFVAPSA